MQYVEIKEQEFDDLVNKLDDVEMEKDNYIPSE